MVTVVVYDDATGKEYRLPTADEIGCYQACGWLRSNRFLRQYRLVCPNEPIPRGAKRVGGGSAFSVVPYGINQWRQLFNPRQLLALGISSRHVHDGSPGCHAIGYEICMGEAIAAYLALAVDRLADRGSTTCALDSRLGQDRAIPLPRLPSDDLGLCRKCHHQLDRVLVDITWSLELDCLVYRALLSRHAGFSVQRISSAPQSTPTNGPI